MWSQLIKLRRDNLTELFQEFRPPDQTLDELLDGEPQRYALVERYPISGHHYISTHGSFKDAGHYYTHQEDNGWTIEFLEDLDTGDRYDGYLVDVEWTQR